MAWTTSLEQTLAPVPCKLGCECAFYCFETNLNKRDHLTDFPQGTADLAGSRPREEFLMRQETCSPRQMGPPVRQADLSPRFQPVAVMAIHHLQASRTNLIRSGLLELASV